MWPMIKGCAGPEKARPRGMDPGSSVDLSSGPYYCHSDDQPPSRGLYGLLPGIGFPMTREAIVLESHDGEALVCPVDSGECDTCEARHACLSLSGRRREERSFRAADPVGVSPGDRVRLELKSSASLTIITVTFMVPVLLLFAGYLAMSGGGDSARALGAGAGLLLGIALALLVNRRLGARRGFSMVIVRILERADGSDAPGSAPMSHMEG